MRTITATSASRGFSELLDAVEHGDTVTITRGGHPVAEIRPVHRHTLRDLRERLTHAPGLDAEFEKDLTDTLALVENEVEDPWAAA
jgi:prevent-host-death family protein